MLSSLVVPISVPPLRRFRNFTDTRWGCRRHNVHASPYTSSSFPYFCTHRVFMAPLCNMGRSSCRWGVWWHFAPSTSTAATANHSALRLFPYSMTTSTFLEGRRGFAQWAALGTASLCSVHLRGGSYYLQPASQTRLTVGNALHIILTLCSSGPRAAPWFGLM